MDDVPFLKFTRLKTNTRAIVSNQIFNKKLFFLATFLLSSLFVNVSDLISFYLINDDVGFIDYH